MTPLLPRLLAALAVTLCATAALAADNAAAVAAAQAQLTRMTPASKVDCRADGYGGANCTADGYSVNLGNCGEGAAFGSIAVDGGIDLTDRIDGQGAPMAHVQDRQFVCIPAMARKGDSQRHYVIVVPTASVPECRGNTLCKDADLPVQWKAAQSGKACQRGKDGDYSGDCAAGWVDVGQIDQYDTLAPMPAKQAK